MTPCSVVFSLTCCILYRCITLGHSVSPLTVFLSFSLKMKIQTDVSDGPLFGLIPTNATLWVSLIVLGWMSWTFYYNIQVTVIVFCCCWQPDIDIFWLVHLGCLFCIRISFISFVFWNSFYFSCRLGCVCLACCVAVGVLGLGKSKSFIFDSVPLFLPFCCTQGFLCFPVLFLCCC